MSIDEPLTAADLAVLSSEIGSSLAWVRRLETGMSAITDVLQRVDEDDEVVVRRHGDWATTHDPGVADRESQILLAAKADRVPVPRSLWSGVIGGRPCLVTERSKGTVLLDPGDPAEFGHRLADALIGIHGVTVGDRTRSALHAAPPGPIDEVDDARLLAHPSGRDLVRVRERLSPLVADSDAIIHGDYHPGNILWYDGAVSAVLDWEAARFGDPAADVAYCATELHLLGQEAAAQGLTAAYRTKSGSALESLPYWAVTAVSRSVGELDAIVTSWRSVDPTHALPKVRTRRDALMAALLESHQ